MDIMKESFRRLDTDEPISVGLEMALEDLRSKAIALPNTPNTPTSASARSFKILDVISTPFGLMLIQFALCVVARWRSSASTENRFIIVTFDIKALSAHTTRFTTYLPWSTA